MQVRQSVLLTIMVLGLACASVVFAQDTEMSVEEANKAFITDYLAAMSGVEKTQDLIAQYVSEEDQALRDHVLFAEAIMPRYEIVPLEMIAEGDNVMVRAATRGVHEGEFLGIAPTGNAIEFEAALRYTIQDGMIIDHWLLSNDMIILQQMNQVFVSADSDTALEAANRAFILEYLEAVDGQVKTRELLEQYISAEEYPILIDQILEGEAGVPTYGFEPIELYAAGDIVIVRARFSGTHEGEWLGVPATGNALESEIAVRFTIRDGLIVDHWQLPDVLSIFNQMGFTLQPMTTTE